MLPPMKIAYDGIVAEKSISYSAARRRGSKQSADVGVSVDGTWQRKSLSSTLGVVTAIFIDNRKVLDVAILSKSCKGYTSMKKMASSDPARYEIWKLSHNCNLNYTHFPWNGNSKIY